MDGTTLLKNRFKSILLTIESAETALEPRNPLDPVLENAAEDLAAEGGAVLEEFLTGRRHFGSKYR